MEADDELGTEMLAASDRVTADFMASLKGRRATPAEQNAFRVAVFKALAAAITKTLAKGR